MSYATLIRNLTSNAVELVGDLATDIQYHSISGEGVYDPVLDVMTQSSTIIPVKAVLSKFSRWDIQNQVAEIEDQKAIIAAKDLGVEPTTRDFVFISGVRWLVQRVQTVPGKGVYILQLRPSG